MACLDELIGLLRSRGFKILAAGQFIGEHSFAHPAMPLATGRPDAANLHVTAKFGRQIDAKRQDTLTEIPREGKPLAVGANYARTQDEWPEKKVWTLAHVGAVEEDTCIHCQKCVAACPMGAISRETLRVAETRCFRCFACVRVCPTGSHNIIFPLPDSPDSLEVYEWFTSLVPTRKDPEIML